MQVVRARNVEEAWARFVADMTDPAILESGKLRQVSPRGMSTLEYVEPVTTVYSHPVECALLDPVRDANPFFHLYEALWILTGKDDVRRVALYSKNIAQFSDDGIRFNGAYGARLDYYDQINDAIALLRADPDTRRCVLQMWEARDLNSFSKDVPCNTAVFLKARDGALHATVTNRSNDAVWGCYGANAVQFSFLLQYVAAALGLRTGVLRQVSDSLHVYTSGPPGELWKKLSEQPRATEPLRPALFDPRQYERGPLFYVPLLDEGETFDQLRAEMYVLLEPSSGSIKEFYPVRSKWLRLVFVPMMHAHYWYRQNDLDAALEVLSNAQEILSQPRGFACDAWLEAGRLWLERRKTARAERETR